MNTVPTAPEPLEPDPAHAHPTWCWPPLCTHADRLTERGQTEQDIPWYDRGKHIGEPWTAPSVDEDTPSFDLVPVRDVDQPATDQVELFQLKVTYGFLLNVVSLSIDTDQIAPLAGMFDQAKRLWVAGEPWKGNVIVDEVEHALRVLGARTLGNAEALLDLTVVELSGRERDLVLSRFALDGDE